MTSQLPNPGGWDLLVSSFAENSCDLYNPKGATCQIRADKGDIFHQQDGTLAHPHRRRAASGSSYSGICSSSRLRRGNQTPRCIDCLRLWTSSEQDFEGCCKIQTGGVQQVPRAQNRVNIALCSRSGVKATYARRTVALLETPA
eukprot:3355076-Rhodomonas_salina.2